MTPINFANPSSMEALRRRIRSEIGDTQECDACDTVDAIECMLATLVVCLWLCAPSPMRRVYCVMAHQYLDGKLAATWPSVMFCDYVKADEFCDDAEAYGNTTYSVKGFDVR